MSSLFWIDFDETERQRAQRIMALFQERESRDELGLGAIRDSIADHLFPGTSTIQTRLRYMLFIPWIYRSFEGRGMIESAIRSTAREYETRLADALRAGGESNGIIGRDAGARLQRLPSSVYWAGLGAWGIRLFPGSLDSLFPVLANDSLRPTRQADREEPEAGARPSRIWAHSLPDKPPNLLKRTSFHLTTDEAQFLVDRLTLAQPHTLLALLASWRTDADCDFIWTHPHLADFPAATRKLVRHGQIFSQVMHGAALLYNLTLSELRERDDWIERYRSLLSEWSHDLDLTAIEAWTLGNFWETVHHPAHAIRPAAMSFVQQWRDIVLASAGDIAGNVAARRLVENRERRLKTSQSRYINRAVRDRWGGESGVNRFTYRWAEAKSHIRDIANAG